MMYGCHNKPRPAQGKMFTVMDGYRYQFDAWNSGTCEPKWKVIPFILSTECQYDKSATDKSCKGCQWAKTE